MKEILKRNAILHFLVTYFRDKDFRKSYNIYLRPDPFKKSRDSIRRELRLIKDYWGCPPYHYFLYKLYKRSFSDVQLLDFLPPFYYTNIYWAKRHAGLNKSFYSSKFNQQQLFERFKIPCVPIVGKIVDGKLIGQNNEIISLEALINKYLKNSDNALFIKPELGAGGHGIMKLAKRSNELYLNNTHVSPDQVVSALSKNENYLIQELFVQSREMAEINKDSVNTLRVCTQHKNGRIVVPLCILRMGMNNSFIDNFCSGGLVAVVNVTDGSLSDYAQTKELDKKYFGHPGSNYLFKGKRIKNWEDIKLQIIKYSKYLSECKDLGWDVAIGEDGISILEINVQQGLDHQLIYNGFRRILGINPDDYR